MNMDLELGNGKEENSKVMRFFLVGAGGVGAHTILSEYGLL